MTNHKICLNVLIASSTGFFGTQDGLLATMFFKGIVRDTSLLKEDV